MNIQLVLSHYLSGLRERDELDALLPELLRAMGHSVLSRPQIGVNQAGVDIVSTHTNSAGEKEVFLYVVKFGDLGREDFYGGKQAVDPSVREASNEFIRNRLPQPLKGLRKRIVLVTNGALKQEAQAGYAALSHDIAERPLCSLELWAADQMTALIEEHLFDETLLLGEGKGDLRATLAALEESETCIRRFVRFAEACLATNATESGLSRTAFKRNFLRRCAAAAMGWAVLLVWGQSEDNLKPGVVSGEYLLLRMWSEAAQAGLTNDKAFLTRMETTVALYVRSLMTYFDKVLPQLQNKRASFAYRPERVLYAELIFEELGRFATLLLLLQQFPNQEAVRTEIHRQLLHLVNEHTGCRLPVYDGQSIDLTLVLAALMGESDWNNAQRLLADTTRLLQHALTENRYLPVDTDLLEDAIALNVVGTAEPRDFFETSTLIPALATLAALLRDEDTLLRLRNDIGPLAAGVTLERWFPEITLETLTGSRHHVQDVGVSRGLAEIRATVDEEMEASVRPFKGAALPQDFKWHGTLWRMLVVLSARLHRHPVPTWFLAEYARPTLMSKLDDDAASQQQPEVAPPSNKQGSAAVGGVKRKRRQASPGSATVQRPGSDKDATT
jgi:AraC-like DNA-binding protein